MKHLLITWLLAALASASAFAETMSDGHVLTSLWKQYQEASKADLPKKEAEILTQIKQEATKRHLPVDFYDAATAYVSCVQRRDWKQSDKLRADLAQEVKDFDEPIVTFLWMEDQAGYSTDRIWRYVNEHPDGFQGNNPALHRNVSGYLGGALEHFIANDKEYVLWRLLPGRTYRILDDDEIYQALKAEVAGRYPNQAALEYTALSRRYYSDKESAQKKADFGELAQRYAGKAISVFPQATVLSVRLKELEDAHAPGTDFEALYRDAEALEKERLAYKGEEKILAGGERYPQSLCEKLTASDLTVRVENGDVLVLFRNLKDAKLTLRRDGKKLKTSEIVNKQCSFYVRDTVRIVKPQLSDGVYNYEAVSGKLSDQAAYCQFTLSLATRQDSRGYCVYVADYQSGKPLGSATVRLMKNDKELAAAKLSLNGFTPLPRSIAKYLNGDAYYQLVAEFGDRRSPQVDVPRNWDQDPDTGPWCHLYRDRGAYNPGDTLQFKAVVYEGNPMLKLNVCPDKKLQVELYDTEWNLVEKQQLTTNAFGSVSGSFVLPKGLKNGLFHLSVAGGLCSESFRVDEFVLPSFELSFDKWDRLYLPGDEIPISGQLTSYSGHKLTGARVALKVLNDSKVVFEGEQEVDADNRFHFTVLAKNSGYYGAEVTVTDATGETLSFKDAYYLSESLSVQVRVAGTANADLTLPDDNNSRYSWQRKPKYVIQDQKLSFTLQAMDAQSCPVPLPVEYSVCKSDGSVVVKAKADSGTQVQVNLPEEGLYLLRSQVVVKNSKEREIRSENECRIYCAPAGSKVLKADARRLFIAGPLTVEAGKPISARLGSAEGTAYTVYTLYGKDGEVLETKCLNSLNGKLTQLSIPYKSTWPDAVRLQVFYFIKGEAVRFEREYKRAQTRLMLPLQFTRFHSSAYPHTDYTFTLKTDAGVEALAAAWDKSMDAIAPNYWPSVSMQDYSVSHVWINTACGYVSDGYPDSGPYYGSGRVMMKSAARGDVLMEAAPMAMGVTANAVADEEVSMEEAADDAAVAADDVPIRSEFSNALTFQPHLLSEADGTLTFGFSTSDKLSTYYVRVYAHDTAMRNALVQDEMVVSLPVKVSLLEPRYLYQGDVYEAALTVSSVADAPVSGLLILRSELGEQQLPVTVEPGATATHRFLLSVPSDLDELTLTAIFQADEFSDAVQVKVPVYPAAQVLTEAHSAVLLSGADREALLADLRSRFVNVPAAEAQLKEITVLDMVRDAIPSHVNPSGRDVLSLSEAWYVRLMAGRLSSAKDTKSKVDAPEGVSSATDEELLAKVMACRNNDGGFGWFEGMSSSPIITAVLLERFAKLRDRGFEVPNLASSVRYLDHTQFGTSLPVWRGWLSDAQYLRVRALYPEVPFKVETLTKADEKRMKEFRTWAKSYLTPSRKDGRGLKGQILAKARRLQTLNDLITRDGGIGLAKSWGVDVTSSKLKKSLRADVASLLEYAVEHRDGGWYYPNAVMPWRGLLESEAYAHSLLCDLLWTVSGQPAQKDSPSGSISKVDAPEGLYSRASIIADGIRLWLMLQKETQHWDTEPAYIDAITSILDGSQAVLDTRVLVLSATYQAPFQAIKAAGNGFTVERKFYRQTAQEDNKPALEEIQPGDVVQVGDKIVAKYVIWNAENRSFVKLTAGREATLRPEEQLSGYLGWSVIRPLRSGISWSFYPQGYRNVKADVTEYFFDSYPEESTEISEVFFVTQAGRFSAPVTVIESLYAPHYRANSAARAPLAPTAR